MKPRQISLAVLMIIAGLFHFLKTDFYWQIVPDYLPYPRQLVLISGVIAVGLGFLVLLKPARNLAVYGIIAYFIAVFPANLYMAFHPEIFPSVPPWVGWARLPLQGVLIYWAYGCRDFSRH